jgi:hypothetical protein
VVVVVDVDDVVVGDVVDVVDVEVEVVVVGQWLWSSRASAASKSKDAPVDVLHSPNKTCSRLHWAAAFTVEAGVSSAASVACVALGQAPTKLASLSMAPQVEAGSVADASAL